MTTFLRDAEDFLARLPSITLDGMDPLFQKQADPLSAKLAASPAVQATEQQVVPNMEDSLRLVTKQSGGDKCVPTHNITLGRPAQPAYSPTSMLYPLTSIESFSDAGQSMDSIDANAMSASRLMTRDSGITAGGYTESDGAEEEEEELGLRRSPRSSGSRSKGSKQPKEKRKVGRPIAYTGDPESADLTPAERRRIKRRIANRESARRVRARRQDQIEDMAQKAQEMERHNMALASHASTVEAQQGAIHAQLAEYTARLRATEAQNDALQREIAHMRAFIASKGLKSEAGASGRQELEGHAASLGHLVNHTSDQAGVSSNPSACSVPATLDARALSNFSNGMQSAFAASAAGPSANAEDATTHGGAVPPASLQMLDMPMSSSAAWPASRGVSGLLLGLGNAASIDQLLPNMDPLGGMSLNEFLLGEAC